MPTIAASMRLLPATFRSRPYRSTDGAVLVGVEGSVRVAIAGEVITLQPKDVLAIPAWQSHTLEADEESVIFSFSDAPVHQKLGLWREERH